MVEVRVKARMRNFVDVALAERGGGRLEDVPVSELDCLIDTGALMVLLPEDEVGKLGLVRGGHVIVTYADDRREQLSTARGLEVTILGRTMVTDCVIGPPLCEPLIGQLVLEELDLIVDCARRQIGPRRESPNLPLLKLKSVSRRLTPEALSVEAIEPHKSS